MTVKSADERLFRPTVARIMPNLEMLLGAPAKFTLDASREADAAEAAALVPEGSTLIAGVVGEGDDRSVVVALDPAVSVALACLLQMVPEAVSQARAAEIATTPLSGAERDALGEIGNFVVAGFGEQLRALGGEELKIRQTPNRFLSGPDAAVIADCLKGRYFAATGTVKVGASVEGRCVLFFAEALVESVATGIGAPAAAAAPKAAAGKPTIAPSVRMAAPAAGARPAAAKAPPTAGARERAEPSRIDAPAGGGTPSAVKDAEVLLVGDAEFVAQAAAGVPADASFAAAAGVGELFAALEAGARPRLVVAAIPADRERLLDLLAAVRRTPEAAGATFVVALGRPTRRSVLRCATAGFSLVLPADAPPEEFVRRSAAVLAAARAKG